VENGEYDRGVNNVLIDAEKLLAVELLDYLWLERVPKDVRLENDLGE